MNGYILSKENSVIHIVSTDTIPSQEFNQEKSVVNKNISKYSQGWLSHVTSVKVLQQHLQASLYLAKTNPKALHHLPLSVFLNIKDIFKCFFTEISTSMPENSLSSHWHFNVLLLLCNTSVT